MAGVGRDEARRHLTFVGATRSQITDGQEKIWEQSRSRFMNRT
jgi:hypothetical protein